MIKIRPSNARGRTQMAWLDSRHTFSFGDYYEPEHENFGSLRVINEDFVKAGMGFGTHGHRNMEIVTYVVEGAIEHKDSLGNSSTIYPGESQMMSAGTGIRHSEFNPIEDQESHFLQIWVVPRTQNLPPRYDQKKFFAENSHENFFLIASDKPSTTSVQVDQEIEIWALKSPKSAGQKILKLKAGQSVWIQNIMNRPPIKIAPEGEKELTLNPGDSCSITECPEIRIDWDLGAEALIFLLKKG
jgi:redox-sensitive bicupin YhaK (pirin superfamily)